MIEQRVRTVSVRRGPARSLVALAVVASLCLSAGCSSLKQRLALASGNRLYKAEKYEEAIVEYDKIIALNAAHWDGNYMKAVSLLALYHPGSTHEKDLEFARRATEALETLIELAPPDPATGEKVRGFYVNLLQQTGELDKAIAFFEKLIQTDPKNLDHLTNAAQMYAKAGNFEKALEYFDRRADLQPDNVDAWYTVGVVCWERSYRGGALVSTPERDQVVATGMAALEKALSIDPEHTPSLAYMNLLWRERAKVFMESQQVQEAGQSILKADEFQKKALAIMNRKRAEAAAADAAAAPPKEGA
jgi:outer membrane protein assembly factor BamD (BamD/ComL family)